MLRKAVLLIIGLLVVLGPAHSAGGDFKIRFNEQEFPGSALLVQDKHKQTRWIEFEPLAQKIGWARHPGHGGWCLRRTKEADGCNLGDLLAVDRVFLEGKPIPTRRIQGRLYLDLAELCRNQAWELQLKGDSAQIVAPGSTLGTLTLPPRPTPGKPFTVDSYTGKGPVLLFFYTQWCPSCWKYFPVIEELARQHSEIQLVECDIDDFGSPLCKEFKVNATPWLCLYDSQGQLTANGDKAEAWVKEHYQVSMPTALKCMGAP
jgi:thiol-disulfide isomerase/thioredoxin